MKRAASAVYMIYVCIDIHIYVCIHIYVHTHMRRVNESCLTQGSWHRRWSWGGGEKDLRRERKRERKKERGGGVERKEEKERDREI